MPTLSINIPLFYCLIRKEYLYDLKEHFGEFEHCSVFGVTSIPARAITFTCMLNNGAQVARLPISAFCWKECDPQPLEVLQLWDCFSYDLTCVEYDYLKGLRVSAFLKDKCWYGGEYCFTLDWYGSPSAENPGEGGFKTAHLLKLDTGNFAAQPNNRICWYEPSFISKPYKESEHKPDYKVNTHVWKCEGQSKWYTEDSDKYFYEIEEGN
jgi:hypothetical protein